MDIIDRLQEIITYEGMNVSSFAKKIGVFDQTIPLNPQLINIS